MYALRPAGHGDSPLHYTHVNPSMDEPLSLAFVGTAGSTSSGGSRGSVRRTRVSMSFARVDCDIVFCLRSPACVLGTTI